MIINQSERTEADSEFAYRSDDFRELEHGFQIITLEKYIEFPSYLPINFNIDTIGFRNSNKDRALVRDFLIL